MVYRVYTEKKKELAIEAQALKNDLVTLVRVTGLEHDFRVFTCVSRLHKTAL